MRECRRVARPDARLALTTNLQGHMQEFYAESQDVLTSLGDREALRRLEQHVAHRATITDVQQLLANNGFTVTRIVQRDGAMRFSTSDALANHHFVRLGFLNGWKAVAGERQTEVFARAAIARVTHRVASTVARSLAIRRGRQHSSPDAARSDTEPTAMPEIAPYLTETSRWTSSNTSRSSPTGRFCAPAERRQRLVANGRKVSPQAPNGTTRVSAAPVQALHFN